jgi:hypothetical protein
VVRHVDLAVPKLATAQRGLLDRPLAWAAIVAICAFAVYHFSFPDQTPFNHYVRLANAFLHGRIDLIDPPNYIEKTVYRGRHYVIPAPFPAALLLPYVALRGEEASQALASHLIGGLGAGLLFLIGARVASQPNDRRWFGMMAACGTILWYLSAAGSTWYFAHVVAAAALSLGVLEALGQQRPILMGLAISAAYLTRQPDILVLPFFLIATMPRWAPGGLRGWRQIDIGYLERLLAPVAAAVAINSLYNWVRFGTVADVANALRVGILNEPWFERGLFHPSYIPRHLKTLFTNLPVLVRRPPYLLVPWAGLAIWVTTPAFVYALRAPASRETGAAWLGILPVLLAVFTYGNPGVMQFGYRFAADIYPLLFLLAARGMRGRPSRLAKVLIVVGVIVNAWGVLGTRWGWQAP